jgi:hypothetical protein
MIGKWLGFRDEIARDYGKVADLAFGYGGSIGAWRRFAPLGDTTSDEQIKIYRDIWRERHPATRHYLNRLHEAVFTTVQTKAQRPFGRLQLYCQTVAGRNWFYIRLPSGRSIPYPFAEIKHYADEGKLRAGVAFMDYQHKRWRPYVSPTGAPVIWPGLLIENVTQGIARDLLAATLIRLRAAGYPPSGHVHDEIFSEVRKGEGSLEEYKSLCELRPDWAVEMDIPVFAKVWERERWAKGVDIPVTHTPGAVITPDQLVKLHKNKVEKPKPVRPRETKQPGGTRHPNGAWLPPGTMVDARIAEQAVARPEPPEIGIGSGPDAELATAATEKPGTPSVSEELMTGRQQQQQTEQEQPPQGVPFMITRTMKEELRACGMSDDEIANLTPQQAHEILQTLNGGGHAHRSSPPPPADNPNASPGVPDRAEAARFLALLDPATTRFTFQTFDDDKERKRTALVRVLNGTLDQHFAELTRLNNLGAGIFVTINETDLQGRRIENVVKVRYLFGDFDNGVPLPHDGPQRYMAVQSSATGQHAYWKPDNVPLDAFTPTQELIAKRFNGDPKVKDVSRVMRLPGFWHRKGEPLMTRIIEIREDAPACSAADFETDEFKYQTKPSASQGKADFDGWADRGAFLTRWP